MIDLTQVTKSAPRNENLPEWLEKTGTEEQKIFVKRIQEIIPEERGRRVVLNALAGTGKSTMLKTALGIIPEEDRVLVCSFAKAIVRELNEDCAKLPIPKKTYFRSINSVGNKILRDNLRKHININRVTSPENYNPDNIELRGDKYLRIVNGILDKDLAGSLYPYDWVGDENFDENEYSANILSLVTMARLYLMTKPVQIEALAKKLGMYLQANEVAVVRKAILRGIGADGYLEGLKTIDYTDQLWWPIAMDRIAEVRQNKNLGHYRWVSPYRYDWVLVDECQDLSAAQRELVDKYCIRDKTHNIFVGDPEQAIMGFAGSDYTSFSSIAKSADFNLPLTVNFRSSRKIGDMVRKVMPKFQTFSGAEQGVEVRRSSLADIQEGDAIIARKNSQLAELFSALIGRGFPCYIVGKAISEAQIYEMFDIWRKPNKGIPNPWKLESLIKELSRQIEARIKKLVARGHTEPAALNDKQVEKLTTYRMLVEAVDKASTQGSITNERQLETAIKKFASSDDPKAIKLVSGHRCKGLEYDRVHIYRKEEFGKPRPGSTSEEIRQEKNLKYVALTRARKEMLYLGEVDGWPTLEDGDEETPEEGSTFKKYGEFASDAI